MRGVLVLLLLGAVAACADDGTVGASAGDALTTDEAGATPAAIGDVLRKVAREGGGHVYVAVDTFSDTDVRGRLGRVLVGDARRKALGDCAIYGGGAAPATDDGDEDPNKYLSPSQHDELARELDLAIGPSDVFRIDSFGIGDEGDDFTATCTVAVRTGADALLVLQGHSRDRLV